ncbi:MAG: hypothetical protein ACE368_16355 [Paracoccaceae bacterium]
MDVQITLDSNLVRMMADIGFLGISRGRFDDAATVFAALRAVRPDEDVGVIGGAVACLGTRDVAGALRILRAARQSETVLAFSCVALMQDGQRDAARDILADLEATAPDSPLTEMARASIVGT